MIRSGFLKAFLATLACAYLASLGSMVGAYAREIANRAFAAVAAISFLGIRPGGWQVVAAALATALCAVVLATGALFLVETFPSLSYGLAAPVEHLGFPVAASDLWWPLAALIWGTSFCAVVLAAAAIAGGIRHFVLRRDS